MRLTPRSRNNHVAHPVDNLRAASILRDSSRNADSAHFNIDIPTQGCAQPMSIDFDAELSDTDHDSCESGDSARSMRLMVRADLDDLAGTLLNLRALRAFDRAAARYPIHRVVRCAARAAVTDLFDDLALRTGLAAQRFDAGALLLDGPGIFATLQGRPKARYTSCTFTFWTDTRERARRLEEVLLEVVGERRVQEETFTMDWRFSGGHGYTTGASFEELADPALVDEAYPALGEPVARFIERYLAAPESILILQGPPGTGKTRLVRAILAAISRRKGASATVLYTADRRALESDRIFMQFITGEHDAFVIEDADHILTSRSSGNEDMHRFLAVADGVVRAQGRKILFTTNLPNVHDIDDALLRPGRCFGNVRTRALNRTEAAGLLMRLCAEEGERAQALLCQVLPDGVPSVTLAQIYRHLDQCSAIAGPAA
jgi:ATPase family associated with various cellular activities (AAA)